MKFKPKTGQDFFAVNGEKGDDKDQRVLDVICTEWDKEYFVKATSKKF